MSIFRAKPKEPVARELTSDEVLKIKVWQENIERRLKFLQQEFQVQKRDTSV